MPAAHKPSQENKAIVKALSAYGVPHSDISEYIGIAEMTLEKHYKKELRAGRAQGNVKVRKFLFDSATGAAMGRDGATYADCLRAAIFWGKTQMGMIDKAQETDATEKIANAIASLVEKLPS